MKKLSFSMFAMAGLLLASCADKDVIGEGGSIQGEELPDGYMALNINLPTTSLSRAENDKFDDGEGDGYEYKVSDCALLLFEGNDEETATLLNAQVIILPFDKTETDGDATDNITTSYQATAQVKEHTSGAKLWALALLNYKEVMAIENGLPTFKHVKGATDGLQPVAKGATLSVIRSLITDANLTTRGGSTDYFFMTNAVLCKDKGGSSVTTAPNMNNVFQLAYMDPSKIKETMEQAKADPAGDIFVERAVAKATIELAANFAKDSDGNLILGEGGLGLKIEKIEWTIDNIEPYTYVARNPGSTESASTGTVAERAYIGYTSGYFTQKGGTGNYRFVSHTTLKDEGGTPDLKSETDAYRTYWCLDPQYSDNAVGMKPVRDANNKVNPNDVTYVEVGDKPLYCYENTFDVLHQNYKNTTRAIIKVTLDNNETFYTINGGQEYYIDDPLTNGSKPAGWQSGEDKITTHVAAYIANKTAVVSAIQKALNANQQVKDISTYLKITYNRNEVSGKYEVQTITVDETALAALEDGGNKVFNPTKISLINDVFTGDDGKDFIAEVNKEYVVRQYVGGEIFYEARFQHFAGTPQATANGKASPDDLAPWNIKEENNATSAWETAPSGGNTTVAYRAGKDGKTAEENYLGRYGMVRNNWYHVTIDAINKIGYPADPSGQVDNPDYNDPDDPNTPDDNIKEYISARIHVLSWAKRMQHWGF